MSLVEMCFWAALTLIAISAILQVVLAIRWTYVERPADPLLKPVTLCAHLARARLSIPLRQFTNNSEDKRVLIAERSNIYDTK